MKNLILILALFSVGRAGAQPKADTSKMICSIELPRTVTKETVLTVKADCKLATFKLDVYSRWGQVMFTTTSTDEYELGQKFKALKEGQYNYLITYSYYRGGVLNERKSNGIIYVVQ